MIFQVRSLFEIFLTVLTLIWFLFEVSPPDMSRQFLLPSKTFLTVFTLKWFLFGVTPGVLFQVRLLLETFLTVLTLVWFLFGVSPDLSCQVTLLSKTFVTIPTLVRVLFGVRPDVNSEGGLSCEKYLTIVTLKWFSVSLVRRSTIHSNRGAAPIILQLMSFDMPLHPVKAGQVHATHGTYVRFKKRHDHNFTHTQIANISHTMLSPKMKTSKVTLTFDNILRGAATSADTNFYPGLLPTSSLWQFSPVSRHFILGFS